MRKIKFRGKSKMTIEELDAMGFEHDNGWFTGNFIMHGNTPYIVGDLIEVDSEYIIHDFWVPVYPDSVGQYTGLQDKHGKEIYEGDVLNHINHDSRLEVSWQELWPGFYYQYIGTEQFHKFTVGAAKHFEIIGNIYEKSELLEEL